ncbi:Transferase [Corchorus olitorius]|uniref:Transferase n=1 Tax=Corchorus olitorius TaxID=93759 RepID=A0A1R3JQ14_9ROSI|nr:Transferase [Corchorus olitorius]
MSAGVRSISSSLVQASTHKAGDEKQRIELTPWDLQLLPLGPIQKGLLFPKPKPKENGHENTFNFIHHLKTSLSQTLDHFPPLAGRLATTEHVDDNTISFYVDCNNAGALFIHAEAYGVTISDIVESVYVPPIVHSFFPLNGVNNHEGVSNPLLGVQVTELVDGVFVGCTINHSIADGTSFWHFFNSWSEISRGSIQYLSKLPIFQRSFLNGIDYPIRISRVYVKESFNHDHTFVLTPLKERVFHFTKQSIAKLKAQANVEVGTNKISSLQALLSHIWQSVVRNKKLEPDEEMNYLMVIGARPRLQELPDQYFGNAVKIGGITMKAKELKDKKVGEIALEMNKMIAAQTEEEFKRALESWIKCPKLITKATMRSNVTGTSSSPWFNIYGNDFGWGRPIAVRSGSANKCDGKITVFRGEEEGSIDIEACLLSETLDAMANDQEFMNFVSPFHYLS